MADHASYSIKAQRGRETKQFHQLPVGHALMIYDRLQLDGWQDISITLNGATPLTREELGKRAKVEGWPAQEQDNG